MMDRVTEFRERVTALAHLVPLGKALHKVDCHLLDEEKRRNKQKVEPWADPFADGSGLYQQRLNLEEAALLIDALAELGYAVVPIEPQPEHLALVLPHSDDPSTLDQRIGAEAVFLIDCMLEANGEPPMTPRGVHLGREGGADVARDYRRLVAAARIDRAPA